MAPPRIAVVGGGLAGLSAARRLRRRGAEVTVLEAASRFGGRAVHEERGGFTLDAGPHVAGARDGRLLALVRDVGLEEALLPLRPVALARARGGVVQRLERSAHLVGGPPHDAGLLGRLRLVRLERLLRRYDGLLDPEAPERAVRLDDRSAADFTRLYFGPAVLASWVAPWLFAEQLASAEEASRASFLLALRTRDRAAAGSFRSGLGRLAEALMDPARDRAGARVRAVAPREGAGLRVALEAEVLEVDAVVLATPAPAALALSEACLRTPEHSYLGGVRYAAATAVCAGLTRSPLHEATRIWVAPEGQGSVLAVVHLEPGSPGGRAPEGAATAALLAGDAWSRAHAGAPDDVVAKALLAALDRLLPGSAAAARTIVVSRWKEALPRFDVGRLRALARFRAVQRDLRAAGRRLYFAGDHLVGPTLEGAVVSGLRAADDAAEDLGLP
jgi:protoporphyrinogen/coproporphyrinogen III oxidase